ncbi:hypothetical protein OBBRIDRAFT_727220, partial [Obba rivulosa]
MLASEDALKSAISLLRRIRNSRQPVNRLPAEVLANIFHYLAYPDFNELNDYRPPDAGSYHKSIVPVIHTCHRWRSIALATPSLWTTL